MFPQSYAPRCCAVVTVLLLLPGAASATTMQAIWFGTVEGHDQTNHLGLGVNYSSTFNLTVHYDTARGVTADVPGGITITGGGTWHEPSPITRVTFTIGDYAMDIGGDNYGQLFANANDPLAMRASYLTNDAAGRDEFQFSLFDSSMPTFGVLDREFSLYHIARYFGGTFFMGGADAGGDPTHYVTGSFYLQGVEVSRNEALPAVPLPPAAALLVGAIGGLGALRVRRKAA